ncbi:MAG: carboxypeptidase regulatory-like domain-containing protein [Acidobacteriota bacterium]|nr:carboxypeptidase regulatory-like domain-containing protein [Acidobacteriota bacterium]
MRTTRIILGLSVACLLFGLPAMAQTGGAGALTGTVTDQQGAIVSGAEITVTNEATGAKRTAVSQDNGDYAVPQLLPGAYRVEFSGAGFKTAVKSGLRINVTETSRLDVQLEVGQVNETIVVTSEAALLQTESAALGRVADQMVVSNLPLSTRNYTQIVTLSPGIAAGVARSDALGRGSGGESGGNFRTHGAFGRDNNFQMNGVQINDLQASGSFSGGVAIPNPDAIEEFKVQTGQYDAAYGRNAGANVNVITKSGSNKFHGTAFEFFRNNALNANDFFRNKAGQPRGILKQNQFGFALGGPLPIFNFGEGGPMFRSGKDKLLFFTSYQGTRQINGVSGGSTSNFFSPPFTNDRSRAALGALFAGQSGAVGGLAVAADGSNISAPAFALLNLRLPNGQFVIPTPQTIDPAQPFARRGFSAVSVPGTFNEDQFMVNLDFLHTDNSKIYGRFFAGDSDLLLPLPVGQTGSPSVPGFPYLIPNTFRNLSVSHSYTFSPTLLNQIDFGYHRIDVGNNQQEVFKFSDIGVTAPPVANLFPVIGVSGSLATGGNGQDVQVLQRHFNIQDSLIYVRGRHTFRFGGGFTHSREGESKFSFFGGVLFLSWPDFLIGRTGAPVAAGGNGSGLSNVFISIDIPGDLDRDWIVKDGNAYIQDDIKLTPSFTLNLGLRYERLGHLADTEGRNSGFDIALANPNPPAGGSVAGFLVSENFPGTVPAGVTQLDNRFGIRGKGQNNFGPRVGFAWKLPDSFLPFTERMVLRGGYGIYHTRATGQAFLQLATGQPFAALRLLVFPPNASFADPFLPEPTLPAFTPYSPTTQVSISLIDPDYRPPITQQYSLNLQTDLGHNFLLETGYVGTRGTHLIYRRSLNQAGLASPANPIRGVTTNTLANIPLRVPIRGFTPTGLADIDSSANSRYDSLEASVTKRLSKGLQFLAAYTFAHAYSDAFVTDASGFGFSGNQNNRRANYGRDVFANREHRFVLSYVYQLPGPKRFNSIVNNLLGGWSVAGVTTIQSGLPLSLFGTNGRNVFGVTGDRAQLAAGCTHANLATTGSIQSRLDGYFNANCIDRNPPPAGAPPGTPGSPRWPVIGNDGVGTDFGNSGVGIVTGPGQNNSDFAIIKRTPIRLLGEGGNIEFRTEFFNVFNHPQFGNPDSSVTLPTFGVISTTSVNARIIQFGLKVNF